jgi:hypothetical protein
MNPTDTKKPSNDSHNLSITSNTIRIQTYGPRGRSGSAKHHGIGWSNIKSRDWDVKLSPKGR